MYKKKNIYNLFYIFIASHILVWTLVPALTNQNLPLDTIEALAWGSNLDWGFEKHPPLSALAVEVFYQIFGKQDWAYYLLSQIFVCFSFVIVWKLSEEFFKNNILSLVSVLLLEGIFYYNFTTPEFNVNVCQLPFWGLTVYYSWKIINQEKIKDFLLLGFFAGLGFLSKYLFIYLLASITIFFILFLLQRKKFKYVYLIPILIFFIVISPHIFWLFKNDFVTISYALKRTGIENSGIAQNLTLPFIFVIKQLGILSIFFILFSLTIKKFKYKLNFKDNKTLFLLIINLVPIFLIFLTSLFFGIKIRTMWITPFYLFFGVLAVYIFQSQFKKNNLKNFFAVFIFIFIISPSIYLYISQTKDIKRTDFPGNEISYLVQKKWDENFSNNISIVVGDEWYAGNLSYHLRSRPKWFNSIDSKVNKIDIKGGVIYVGNSKILKNICPGIFGTIKPVGICMIGIK
jgi:4-amino-4-deoxy-L-arabinose transferase-like glycosyltransferase